MPNSPFSSSCPNSLLSTPQPSSLTCLLALANMFHCYPCCLCSSERHKMSLQNRNHPHSTLPSTTQEVLSVCAFEKIPTNLQICIWFGPSSLSDLNHATSLWVPLLPVSQSLHFHPAPFSLVHIFPKILVLVSFVCLFWSVLFCSVFLLKAVCRKPWLPRCTSSSLLDTILPLRYKARKKRTKDAHLK